MPGQLTEQRTEAPSIEEVVACAERGRCFGVPVSQGQHDPFHRGEQGAGFPPEPCHGFVVARALGDPAERTAHVGLGGCRALGDFREHLWPDLPWHAFEHARHPVEHRRLGLVPTELAQELARHRIGRLPRVDRSGLDEAKRAVVLQDEERGETISFLHVQPGRHGSSMMGTEGCLVGGMVGLRLTALSHRAVDEPFEE
ncbi:MAG TPA: hypothetical protein VFK02_33290 [Kofleriaceae bacterium]|nr:hypothetical protein [Kofleriaceae bacterium]